MRLFYAVPVPEKHHRELSRFQKDVPARVRWVSSDGFHITLKFLGEVSEDLLSRFQSILEDLAIGESSFQVTFNRLGCFPKPQRASVLWMGVAQGADLLTRWASRLESKTEELGVEPERRAFQAHMTLGRMKIPSVIEGWDREIETISFRAETVVLFRSTLTPGGAIYERMASATLAIE